MIKKQFLCLMAGIFVMLSGCGYTTNSLLPSELDSIHINNFKNEINTTKEISDKRSNYTYRPGLENDITQQVINKFIFNNNLDIKSESKASMLLEGALVDFKLIPLSYNRDENVEEFRIEIFVNMILHNRLTGKIMWSEKGFMGEYTYALTGPNSMTENAAVPRAVDDLANRIVERVVEAW